MPGRGQGSREQHRGRYQDHSTDHHYAVYVRGKRLSAGEPHMLWKGQLCQGREGEAFPAARDSYPHPFHIRARGADFLAEFVHPTGVTRVRTAASAVPFSAGSVTDYLRGPPG